VKRSALRPSMTTIYRNELYVREDHFPVSSPTSADLERERLEARKAPVQARIAQVDREPHPMSSASKAERAALLRERWSLARQLAFIETQIDAVR
jgi:hypothetical protein